MILANHSELMLLAFAGGLPIVLIANEQYVMKLLNGNEDYFCHEEELEISRKVINVKPVWKWLIEQNP